MKKFFFRITYIFIIINLFISKNVNGSNENITGLSNKDLKEGNIDIDKIPNILISATDFFIMIAGTISVIFIIIGGYKYLFGSLEENTDRGKDTIFMALVGFIISSCAWLIVKFVINNFETSSNINSIILN